MRSSVTPSVDNDICGAQADVIFSLVDGFVWASWPGAISTVRLGRYEAVLYAMRDFAAQSELGARLTALTPPLRRREAR